jgi:hypothetical protein
MWIQQLVVKTPECGSSKVPSLTLKEARSGPSTFPVLGQLTRHRRACPPLHHGFWLIGSLGLYAREYLHTVSAWITWIRC